MDDFEKLSMALKGLPGPDVQKRDAALRLAQTNFERLHQPVRVSRWGAFFKPLSVMATGVAAVCVLAILPPQQMGPDSMGLEATFEQTDFLEEDIKQDSVVLEPQSKGLPAARATSNQALEQSAPMALRSMDSQEGASSAFYDEAALIDTVSRNTFLTMFAPGMYNSMGTFARVFALEMPWGERVIIVDIVYDEADGAVYEMLVGDRAARRVDNEQGRWVMMFDSQEDMDSVRLRDRKSGEEMRVVKGLSGDTEGYVLAVGAASFLSGGLTESRVEIITKLIEDTPQWEHAMLWRSFTR